MSHPRNSVDRAYPKPATNPRLPWFLNPFLLITIAAIAIGAWETYRYWGYFLVRPALVDEIKEFETVEGWGSLEWEESTINWQDLENPELEIGTEAILPWPEVVKAADKSCEKASRFFTAPACLYNEATIYFNSQKLITNDTPQMSSTSLMDWHHGKLVETGLIEIPQTDYLTSDYRLGLIVAGHDRQDTPLMFIGLQGGQVENDHYPYYEVILRRNIDAPGGWEVIAQRIFAIEIAGLEQVDHIIWIYYAVIWWGLLLPIPLLFYAPKLWKRFKAQ